MVERAVQSIPVGAPPPAKKDPGCMFKRLPLGADGGAIHVIYLLVIGTKPVGNPCSYLYFIRRKFVKSALSILFLVPLCKSKHPSVFEGIFPIVVAESTEYVVHNSSGLVLIAFAPNAISIKELKVSLYCVLHSSKLLAFENGESHDCSCSEAM